MQGKWLNFCHLNIRSISTGFDLFSELVTGESYDVLGLSETFLNKNTHDSVIRIPGYKVIRNDREGRGGGVAFYVKDAIKFKILEVPNNGLVEQLWISIRIKGKKLCLGTLYRPPHVNLPLCIENVENVLTNLLPDFDYVLFGGDFNVDFLNKNSLNFNLFNSLLNKYGLHQLIEHPTRITDTSSTLIDIIISSSLDLTLNTDVLNMDGISDHCLVKCNLKIKKLRQPTIFHTFRDFSKFNYDSFLGDLSLIDFDNIYSLESVDEMINFWNVNLLHLFDKHAPFKSVRITKPRAPWLTDNLKIMMKVRDKAFLKYKKNKTDTAWNDYKVIRNLVNISIKAEKRHI